MSVRFNVDEVFQIAQHIERNGARFYRRGAEIVADPGHREVLLRLAATEDAHEQVVAAFRAGLTESERTPIALDPDDQVVRALQLQVIADGHVFKVDEDPCERLTGKETVEAILRMAIDLEKDSVVFYTGIKEMVPERLGRDTVDDIINTEMSHIAILSEKLSSLEG